MCLFVQEVVRLEMPVRTCEGWCRERPRVLFGQKEAWWFFVRSSGEAGSAGAEKAIELHMAADTREQRDEWRVFIESMESADDAEVRLSFEASTRGVLCC